MRTIQAGKRRRPGRRPGLASSLLLFSLLASSVASTHPNHSSKQAPPSDVGYVFALATVNRFLHAWQSDDLETGMVMLSDSVRHSHTPENLEQFFSGGTGRAFEIGHGSGNHGRYSFPIVLVTTQGSRNHRKFSEIIVVNTGKNDWAVDKLP